jgi:hypothetical protein
VRATSPSGVADYEGRVAWSGELGFGVRPPEVGQSRPESEADTREADVILSHPGEPGGHPVDTPIDELGHVGEPAEPDGEGSKHAEGDGHGEDQR